MCKYTIILPPCLGEGQVHEGGEPGVGGGGGGARRRVHEEHAQRAQRVPPPRNEPGGLDLIPYGYVPIVMLIILGKHHLVL